MTTEPIQSQPDYDAIELALAKASASSFRSAFDHHEINETIKIIFENLIVQLELEHDSHKQPRSLFKRLFFPRISLKEKLLSKLKFGIIVALDKVNNQDKKKEIIKSLGLDQKISITDRILRPIKYGIKSSQDILIEKIVKAKFKSFLKPPVPPVPPHPVEPIEKVTLREKSRKILMEDETVRPLLVGYIEYMINNKKKPRPADFRDQILLFFNTSEMGLILKKKPTTKIEDTTEQIPKEQNVLVEVILQAIGAAIGSRTAIIKPQMYPSFYEYLRNQPVNDASNLLKIRLLAMHEEFVKEARINYPSSRT